MKPRVLFYFNMFTKIFFFKFYSKKLHFLNKFIKVCVPKNPIKPEQRPIPHKLLFTRWRPKPNVAIIVTIKSNPIFILGHFLYRNFSHHCFLLSFFCAFLELGSIPYHPQLNSKISFWKASSPISSMCFRSWSTKLFFSIHCHFVKQFAFNTIYASTISY